MSGTTNEYEQTEREHRRNLQKALENIITKIPQLEPINAAGNEVEHLCPLPMCVIKIERGDT